MTRILIVTLGSHGDVQPFVALGKALQAAGYDVALQTSASFQPFIEQHGLTYAAMSDDFVRLTETQTGQQVFEGKGKLALLRMVMPLLRNMMEEIWRAAQDFRPDALIYHPKALGTYHVAEKLDVPALTALALPLLTPTRAYPIPILPALRLGGGFNRLSYALMGLVSAPYSGVINDFRAKSLGLPARGRFASEQMRADGSPVPVLYCYSPAVLPVPDDYPAHVHVTGCWFLARPAGWQPSADLLRFLDAGAPPVYVGFGSMGGTRTQERARIVLDALAQSGQRGLLARGWGGMQADALPENVMMIDSAPHDWLFPRMAAVVHHGGAGTTAAGLLAGKPSVIVPFIVDQPFWGSRVQQLGAGPAPIPQGRLTAASLASAITQAVSDPAMRRRAEALGATLRAEDGTGSAVNVIRRYVGAPTAEKLTV